MVGILLIICRKKLNKMPILIAVMGILILSDAGSSLSFKYKYIKDEGVVEMEISTPVTGTETYVALALANESKMENSEGYYCTDNIMKSFVIQERWKTPVEQKIPKGVTLKNVGIANGILTCTIVRGLSVSKSISGNTYDFDLSKNSYHVLLATGPLSESTGMLRHNDRKNTDKIDIVSEIAQDTMINASTCNANGKNCIRHPSGCSPTNASCFFFSLRQVGNTVSMEISGGIGSGSQYAAVAFTRHMQMKDADLYFCDGQRLQSAVIREFAQTPVDLDDKFVKVKSVVTRDGVGQCRFSRDLCVTKTISGGYEEDFDFAKTHYYILFAYGNMSKDGHLTNHGEQKRQLTQHAYPLGYDPGIPYQCAKVLNDSSPPTSPSPEYMSTAFIDFKTTDPAGRYRLSSPFAATSQSTESTTYANFGSVDNKNATTGNEDYTRSSKGNMARIDANCSHMLLIVACVMCYFMKF